MFRLAIRISVALWIAVWATAALPVSAQITTGTISGAVKDAQGAVVPGATVTLVSAARGTTTETQTNTDGDFVFPNVTAGTYLGPRDDGRLQDARAPGHRRQPRATGSSCRPSRSTSARWRRP